MREIHTWKADAEAGSAEFALHIAGQEAPVRCFPGNTILDAANRATQAGIRFGCRGGGCGLCKIRVSSGVVAVRAMSRVHVPEAALAEGYVLACRAYPRSDIAIEIEGVGSIKE